MDVLPFSLVLLLLVMMHTEAVRNIFADCDKPKHFCFYFDTIVPKRANWGSPNMLWYDASVWTEAHDGIVLDTSTPNCWYVTTKMYLDGNGLTDAETRLSTPILLMQRISIEKLIARRENVDLRGITIQLISYDPDTMIMEHKMHLPAAQYISDVLLLYVKPDLQLGLFKKTAWHTSSNVEQMSPKFRPFQCNPIFDEKPDTDATVPKNTPRYNRFECDKGYTVYAGGVNLNTNVVYCGEGGWRNYSTVLLPQKEKERRRPYCSKETIFTECAKNRCFVFGDALKVPQTADKLVKVDDPSLIATKLGAYIEYVNDTTWMLQVAYQKSEKMEFLRIGDESFAFFGSDGSIGSIKRGRHVTVTVTRVDPGTVTGIAVKIFKFEANADRQEKDLMSAFRFYENTPNKIELVFQKGAGTVEVRGIATYKSYKRKSTHQNFAYDASVMPIDQPDVDNLFKCAGDNLIFLDDLSLSMSEVRFTEKGWLTKDGKLVSEFKTEDNAEIIEYVFCYSLCQDKFIDVGNDPVQKPVKDPTKWSYKCDGNFVKVGDKLYTSVYCEDNKWLGNSNQLSLTPSNNKIHAECHGAFKFVKPCTEAEKDRGCGEIIITKELLTCEPGFALTLTVQSGAKTSNGSLRVNVDDHWFDNKYTNFGKTEFTDRPECTSKCAASIVTTAATGEDSRNAKYTYDRISKAGSLTCSEPTDVLVATFEGSSTPYVKSVTCDKDGWKVGGVVKAQFPDGTVKAECFKSCAEKRLSSICPTGWDDNLDCGKVSYLSNTLSCPATHILIVNGKPLDKELVCAREGWTKKGESTPLIIDHISNYKEPINVECYARCGKQFVTSKARVQTTSGFDLICPDSDTEMISYKLNGNEEIDTLDEMKCDNKIGWKDGNTQIVTFSTGVATKITAICKQSCTQSLFKKNCADHSPGCDEAKLTGTELKCEPGKWLWAENKVELASIQCKKKSFENAAKTINIDRTSATSQAEISCISKCDKAFMITADDSETSEKAAEIAGKLKSNDQNGKYVVECSDELHYATITHGDTTKYTAEKWTCDPLTGWTSADYPIPNADWFDGQTIKKGCHNKCTGRLKANSCNGLRDCKEPQEIDNKIKCEGTHVLRANSQDFVSGELQCKIDGFYANNAQVLKFEEKAGEDVKMKFDVTCISASASASAISELRSTDNISTGAMAGIISGVILALGLIVFLMVFGVIRRKRELERKERLKTKGLEQKQESSIDASTTRKHSFNENLSS